MVRFTVILGPFQSPVALVMSSPASFGDRPWGQSWGPGQTWYRPPHYAPHCMTLVSLVLNLGGMEEADGVESTRIPDNPRK